MAMACMKYSTLQVGWFGSRVGSYLACSTLIKRFCYDDPL